MQFQEKDREDSKWILKMLDQGDWNRILENTRFIAFDVLMVFMYLMCWLEVVLIAYSGWVALDFSIAWI